MGKTATEGKALLPRPRRERPGRRLPGPETSRAAARSPADQPDNKQPSLKGTFAGSRILVCGGRWREERGRETARDKARGGVRKGSRKPIYWRLHSWKRCLGEIENRIFLLECLCLAGWGGHPGEKGVTGEGSVRDRLSVDSMRRCERALSPSLPIIPPAEKQLSAQLCILPTGTPRRTTHSTIRGWARAWGQGRSQKLLPQASAALG